MANGVSINTNQMIKEDLEHQKRKKNFGIGKNRSINIIANIIDYPSHEFLKSHLMTKPKLIIPFDGCSLYVEKIL